MTFATKVLEKLGVVLNEDKTRIVHVRHGFEFLGYKIKRGSRPLRLPAHKIKSQTRQGALYAYPRQKSIDHFKEQIRKRTRRKASVTTGQLIDEINPIRSFEAGAIVTRRPMSESYSTGLIDGLGGGSGRIATNVGVMQAGKYFRNPSCTVSWGL